VAKLYTVTTGSVALTATTAKTVAELTTTSATTLVWVGFEITFDGATATNVPVKVELVSYTGASTGTAFTLLKANGEAQNMAATSTAKINDTVEPTGPTVRRSWAIPPTSGVLFQYPLGREIGYQPASSIYGIRCTAPNNVNVYVNADVEGE
jgi:hypothetical protein